MARKPPVEERRIILARDHRRRYGARLVFRVLDAQHVGTLASVTLLFSDGSFGSIRQDDAHSWEMGIPYELELEAYPSAAEAETAGMQAAQALLLTAISLNFGIRLDYSSHQPPTVFDRTVSTGMALRARAITSWPEDVILQELITDFQESLRDRKMLLSMELFASSSLEANDRARFLMSVSALEPLAISESLSPEVDVFVDRMLAELRADTSIPVAHRPSLEGRLQQLRTESVRQALARLCARWFPGNTEARGYIEYVYGLRSQILHDGSIGDPDVLLSQETNKVRNYIRQIYQQEFRRTFRAATAA